MSHRDQIFTILLCHINLELIEVSCHLTSHFQLISIISSQLYYFNLTKNREIKFDVSWITIFIIQLKVNRKRKNRKLNCSLRYNKSFKVIIRKYVENYTCMVVCLGSLCHYICRNFDLWEKREFINWGSLINTKRKHGVPSITLRRQRVKVFEA